MKRIFWLISFGLLLFTTFSFAAERVVVIPMGSGAGTTPVLFSGKSNSDSTKRYASIAGSGGLDPGPNSYPMTRSGIIKNFTLYIHSNQINANCTVQIAIEKNGVTTAISFIYDDDASGLQTIPGTVSFNAGDRIAVFALDTCSVSLDLDYTGAFDIEY